MSSANIFNISLCLYSQRKASLNIFMLVKILCLLLNLFLKFFSENFLKITHSCLYISSDSSSLLWFFSDSCSIFFFVFNEMCPLTLASVSTNRPNLEQWGRCCWSIVIPETKQHSLKNRKLDKKKKKSERENILHICSQVNERWFWIFFAHNRWYNMGQGRYYVGFLYAYI